MSEVDNGDKRYTPGTKVYKVFNGVKYAGEVTGYDHKSKLYHIKYDNGDLEGFFHDKVHDHLNHTVSLKQQWNHQRKVLFQSLISKIAPIESNYEEHVMKLDIETIRSISELNTLGLNCIFTIIGEGSAVKEIKRRCSSYPSLFIYQPSMVHEEIHVELEKHHIGVLPMPESKVWTLASPLKRGEYLASGLMVVGIDHDGHRLQGVNKKWFHLNSEPSLTDSIYGLFNNLSDEEFNIMSTEAQDYAIEHLSWEGTVEILISQIRGEVNG